MAALRGDVPEDEVANGEAAMPIGLRYYAGGRGYALRSCAAVLALVLISGTCACGSVDSKRPGKWMPATLAGTDDRLDSRSPAVGAAPDGRVWIVWSAIDPHEYDDEILYVALTDTGWTEQSLLHASNSGMDRIPFMSVGADGVPWVIWETYQDGYEQVVSHWDGESWTFPERVLTQGGRYDWYTIHAVSSEDVWVARHSRGSGTYGDSDVYVRHWDGRSWGDIEQLGTGDRDDREPVVVVDGDGRTHVVWMSKPLSGGYPDVYAAMLGPDGWSEAAVVDSSIGNIVMCDANLLPDGRPVVVWKGNGHCQSTDIEYAILEEWGWNSRGRVNERDNPSVDGDASAMLDRNASGDLWVVWSSRDIWTGESEIRAAQWLGDSWSCEERASNQDTLLLRDGQPDVAVAEDGTVWAVWARDQRVSPYDLDIFKARRDTEVLGDVSGFSAAVLDGCVELSWQVSGSIAGRGFHVWRLEGESGGHEIPEDAVRITRDPISRCRDCRLRDAGVAPGAYSYWLQSVEPRFALGPATVSVPGESGLETGIVLVSPNPAGGTVRFRLRLTERMRGWLNLYNVGGRLVHRWPVAGDAAGTDGKREVVVDWSGDGPGGMRVAGGVYFAVLDLAEGGPAGLPRAAVVLR